MIDSATALARALSAIGKNTVYELDSPPPDTRLNAWPNHIRSDCSGFVGWCFGQGRHPAALNGEELSTNTIYLDAVHNGRHALFEATAKPEVGGIVIYPHYCFVPGGNEHAGHVALITRVRSSNDYDIVDCASSSYNSLGDAIREHLQSAFSAHADAATNARRDHPNLPAHCTRAPIFARVVS